MSSCPISSFMRRLRIFAGLPVPYVVKYVDGKPDFRQTDNERWLKCVDHKLCAMCGTKLGSYAFYVGGLQSVEWGYFTDTGMHLPCARTAMGLCPFLSGARDHYRVDEKLPATMGVVDISKGRPEVMYLAKGLTQNAKLKRLDHRRVILSSGKLEIVEEF